MNPTYGEPSDVITQFNTILAGTPLGPIRHVSDITPSLLLDLYELLFHIKLAYTTPRDYSADSKLRNIRVLIGHIAHDVLKMDLSFLEPQKICRGDEQALRDFLRIFLGVTKLRKAYLEKREKYHQQQVAGATSTLRGSSARWGDGGEDEDESSLDGSEHTVRAASKKGSISSLRRHQSPVKGNHATPGRVIPSVKKTPSKTSMHGIYTPSIYRPRQVLSETDTAPTAPSDTSTVPSDFIENSNEKVNHILNRLHSRVAGQPSDQGSGHQFSHSPRRPRSTMTQDSAQPELPEDVAEDDVQLTPLKPRPKPPPSLAEPTPYMKAWLDTTSIDTSTLSHKPRSAQSTPEKRPPVHSTHGSPTPKSQRPVSFQETPSRPYPATVRSSRNRSPQRPFPLRRSSSDPTASIFRIDVSKAMFSNSPIRLSGHAAGKHHESESSGDEGEVDDETTSEIHSPASSIATSALSVSSIEWSDTASIKALRKQRLDALEDVKREQDAATAPITPSNSASQAQNLEQETPESGESQKRIMNGHSRRRSSIPSTFMHRDHQTPKSTVSYDTISPNSSASNALEHMKPRWRDEDSAPRQAVTAEGSPMPRRNGRNLQQRYAHEGYDDDDETGRDDTLTTRNTEDLELELRGLDAMGISESKRQIMLFERLIRRAVDKKMPGT